MGEFVKYFSPPNCHVLTPQLNKELGFWKSHSTWRFFLLLSRNFCFSSKCYLYFGARERALDCGEWGENSKNQMRGNGNAPTLWTQVSSQKGREEATALIVSEKLAPRWRVL